MTVLMSNTRVGIRRRVEGVLNSHGERTSGGWGAMGDLLPALVEEQSDSTWMIGVDPELWPVREGDLLVSEDGFSWLVNNSDLLTNSVDPTVNWVRCIGAGRHLGATLPPDTWFVARFADTVDPSDPTPGDQPVRDAAGLWVGHGPPPATPWGAEAGDEYMDLLTGTVYRYGGDQ